MLIHYCNNGNKIRTYASLVCSLCKPSSYNNNFIADIELITFIMDKKKAVEILNKENSENPSQDMIDVINLLIFRGNVEIDKKLSEWQSYPVSSNEWTDKKEELLDLLTSN